MFNIMKELTLWDFKDVGNPFSQKIEKPFCSDNMFYQ